MKRLTGLLVALALGGCATMSSEVAAVEATVSARSSTLATLALPRFDVPEDVPSEVQALLEKPLSADDAVKVAFLANRDARAALAEVGVSRGAFVQAGLLPNPEVEFAIRDPGGPQPAQLDFGLELNIAATVMTPLRSAVAESALEAERLKAAGALLDLSYRTRLAWLDVQASARRLELRLAALESQQASWDAMETLEKAGNVNGLQVATERVAVEQARLQVAEAENALLDAREALTRRLGLSGAQLGWKLAGSLEAPVLPAADALTEALAVTNSLELAEAKARAEAASRKVTLAATEGWLPHLQAGFHGERDGALWELGAHMTVGLPLLDQAQGRQLSAKSEYHVVRARAEGQALAVRSAVRVTWNRLESATKRATHYATRLLPARRQALDETVLQYNAMQVGVFQVLAAQRAVTETALAEVDARLEAQRALAALELLKAGRFTPLEFQAVSTSNSGVDARAMEGGH
ncbi:MAG: TolC family protein [Myxococcaceae bacterium]